jgi:hypothetical protein
MPFSRSNKIAGIQSAVSNPTARFFSRVMIASALIADAAELNPVPPRLYEASIILVPC